MEQYLYINTFNHQKVEIALIADGNKIGLSNFSSQYQFQIKDRLLKTIDKILTRNKLILEDLNGIVVVNKSREMTSLRIGTAVANALAYSLNIPVVGIDSDQSSKFKKIKKFKPIIPEYEINPMLKNF